MDSSNLETIFENRKDKVIAGITGLIAFVFSYIIFVTSPGTSYFRSEQLLLLALLIGVMIFIIQISPSDRIIIRQNHGYIEFLTTISSKKVSGIVKWEDVIDIQIVEHDAHKGFFTKHEVTLDEIWRTQLICRFKSHGSEQEVSILGNSPAYTENIRKLINWGMLVRSDSNVPLYALNSEKVVP